MKHLVTFLLLLCISSVQAQTCDKKTVGRHVAIASGTLLAVGVVAGTAVALAIPVGTATGPTILAATIAGKVSVATATGAAATIAVPTGIASGMLGGLAVSLHAIEKCL